MIFRTLKINLEINLKIYHKSFKKHSILCTMLFKYNLQKIKIINKVVIVTIVVNLLLSIAKVVAGIVGNSMAMISDAVHSASDVLSSIVVFIGARIAVKSEDKEHNYGHSKFENIASLLLALMLFFTAIALGYAGIQSIYDVKNQEFTKPSSIALVASIFSIIIKEAMYWYTIHYAKLIKSQSLKADAWHHRSDAFSSIASFVGILGAMNGVFMLEGIATLFIALLIFKVAYDIIKAVLSQMTDHSAPEKTVSLIYKTINEDSEVKNIDMLKTRVSGAFIYVDVEISVDDKKSLKEAHEIANRVHDNIENTFSDVKHITVHVNPYCGEKKTEKHKNLWED